MKNPPSKQAKIIGVLIFLFVAVFATDILVRYGPWSSSASQGGMAALAGQSGGSSEEAAPFEGEMPVLELELDSGTVTIQLRPDLAPEHVARIVELSEAGFYDGIVFHRVIEGFMAQTGDPTGTGMGGSDLPDLKAEFTNQVSFQRGVLGMARSADPDSANSQFFIVFADASFLDGQYTIFGEVLEGMDFVDNITKGDPSSGQVDNPDKIISMRVKSDQ